VVELADRAEKLVLRRVELRERLKGLPSKAQGLTEAAASEATVPALQSARLGYTLRSTEVLSNIFIPKYYNPGIRQALQDMKGGYELRSIGELEAEGILSLSTGIEVGKLAYGTGDIPFVRTSDLANWELAGQPKQRISRELYLSYRERVDLQPDDILLVRDGTYLIGTSAILTSADAEALYAGGIYRMRSLDSGKLDPYLLLVLLNTQIVRQQIRARQFTRDIIDTLGRRLLEVVLPIPKSAELASGLAQDARATVEERTRLRDEAKALVLDVEGGVPTADEEESELAKQLAV
jgi:type I restriction enzyme M protein